MYTGYLNNKLMIRTPGIGMIIEMWSSVVDVTCSNQLQ